MDHSRSAIEQDAPILEPQEALERLQTIPRMGRNNGEKDRDEVNAMDIILKRSPQGLLSFELRIEKAEDQNQLSKGLELYNIMDGKADAFIKERMEELREQREKRKLEKPTITKEPTKKRKAAVTE